jgi:hypothetical protein
MNCYDEILELKELNKKTNWNYFVKSIKPYIENIHKFDIIHLETNYKLVIHKYIKYHVPLFLDTKGFLRSRCAYDKYFNTFEVPKADPVILEMCQTDNIQGLIDYLIASGRNKMRIG